METIITTVRVARGQDEVFVRWQSSLHSVIMSFDGFESLEIATPNALQRDEHVIIQRFSSHDALQTWLTSTQKKELFGKLAELVGNDLQERMRFTSTPVTEVFITKVSPDRIDEYQAWLGKIHHAEALFPGFQRVSTQAPKPEMGECWVTLLEFDTEENLDRWLHSPERKGILAEAKKLITSLESHRVTSPFMGWFGGIQGPVWKQTMLLLLILYPIVMLELKYLYPLLHGLNVPLLTFIGNAISIALLAWPFMPLAIYFLGWWLSPDPKKSRSITFLGTFFILALYALELALFW